MEIAIWIVIAFLFFMSTLLYDIAAIGKFANDLRKERNVEDEAYNKEHLEQLKSIESSLDRIQTAMDDIKIGLIEMPTSQDIKLAMSLALFDIEMKLRDMPTSKDIEHAMSNALSHHEDFTSHQEDFT